MTALFRVDVAAPRPMRNAVLAAATTVGASLLFLLQGHSLSRALQLALLMLPGALALLLPLRSRRAHRWRAVLVSLWTLLFLLDGALRSFIADAYRAAPDSGFVLGAVANSNWREGSEYARSMAPTIAGWALALALCLFGASWLASFGNRVARPSGPVLAVVALLLSTAAAAYAVKPWRKLHPVVAWSNWGNAVHGMRAEWHRYDAVRAGMHARAAALRPVIAGDAPSTVVLVIADSVNRANMSLYGYARATTPALAALKGRLGADMLVIRDAWSVDASTLPALNQLFALDQDNDDGDDAHLLALARAAGYRTWWIGNHDDLAIEQRHARLADVVGTVNRSPGRSGGGLDERVVDDVRLALRDGAARKFIVVHLLGAHPYYTLRYPKDGAAFRASDTVDAQLAAAGRSWRTGMLRKEYDSAIRYHDTVVARLLELVQAPPPAGAGENRAWMYLSDHGQEVGHGADFAGHSPLTPDGYRIPALVWRNRPWPAGIDLANRPFRADWASWALADLLRLEWPGAASHYNVLGADYAWDAPRLPVRGDNAAARR